MQKSFSDLEYAAEEKLTRRDRFLAEIDSVTPWRKLHKLVEPPLARSKASASRLSFKLSRISFVPKSYVRQIRFDVVQAKRRMCGAFPLTLNRTGRATGIASQCTELALLLIRQLPRSASVPASEQADQSKFVPSVGANSPHC